MTDFKYKIVKYSPEFEPALLELERNATQGKMIQLQMLRDSYLSRSVIFGRYQVYLTLNPAGELLGVLAASVASVMQNNALFKAGSCYDVRVRPESRGHGLTKKMGLYATEDFYKPNKVKGQFLTMKYANHAVYRSARILGVQLYQYPFYYLTIPTFKKIRKEKDRNLGEPFRVFYHKGPPGNETYFEYLDNPGGPGFWHTHKMYRLKIRHMHPLIKAGVGLVNFFKHKDRRLPTEGEALKYSVLFNTENCGRHEINETLRRLQHAKINYLSVACGAGGGLYKLLKPYAINAYPYILLSTFPTSPDDEIGLDVRCL